MTPFTVVPAGAGVGAGVGAGAGLLFTQRATNRMYVVQFQKRPGSWWWLAPPQRPAMLLASEQSTWLERFEGTLPCPKMCLRSTGILYFLAIAQVSWDDAV